MAATSRTLLRLRPSSLPFSLLLLPPRELLQLLDQLVDLVVGLLLLPATDGLVLVLELVELEFEEVGKVFGRLLPGASSAPLLILFLLHVALVGLLSLLKEAQRGLLVGQCSAQLLRREILLRLAHRLHRLREDGGHVSEAWICARQPTVFHALQECADLLLQSSLGERYADHVLAELARAVAVLLADEIESGRDHLPLHLGQRGLLLLPTAATAATLLSLAIRTLERADAQEEHVARDRLATGAGSVVPHERVVGHQVTDLQLPILEKERVACGDFRQRGTRSFEDRQSVLFTAVDRVDQADVSDAVVVVGAHLEVHLLDRRGGDVPPGVREPDRRCPISEHVDVVFGRRRHHLAVVSGEHYRIEAGLRHGERSEQRTVGFYREVRYRRPVPEQLTAWRRHGRVNTNIDAGACEGRDITAVLSRPGIEARVAREVVGEVESVHMGKVCDIDRERGGSDSSGLDEVFGAVIHRQ